MISMDILDARNVVRLDVPTHGPSMPIGLASIAHAPYFSWLETIIARSRPRDGAYKEGGKRARFKPHRAPTPVEIKGHFSSGPKKVGTYPMQIGSSITLLWVVDLDDHDGTLGWDELCRRADAVTAQLGENGLCPARFRSSGGKGIHLWGYWDEEQDAYSVRQLLKQCVLAAGLEVKAGVAEVFPAQDSILEGRCGNPVFWPIERLDGGEWLPSAPVPYLETPARPAASIRAGNTDLRLLGLAVMAIPNGGDDGEEQPYGDGGEFGWLKVGMALHDATRGGDEGLELWHEWSAQSGTKYDPRDLERRWRSFKGGGGVTAATIFHVAKENGFNIAGARAFLGLEVEADESEVPGRDDPSGAAGAEWPEPKPIHAELHPVPSFDPEVLLPESLRGWVMDEADRMPCPPEYVTVAALVAIGAIVGARCAMKPKALDSWLVVPNLWGGIVGQPSAKKSPAIEAALKPLNRLVALAMETHQAELEAFEAEKLVFEAKKEGIEARIKAAAKDPKKGDVSTIVGELQAFKEQAPKAPTLRRYKSNDTTVEKLGELLRENPSGLLVLRDELVGLVATWEREGREGERAFYLEAWNGNSSFDTDRIGRGSIFIPNLCVSIFGGIQPDKLTGYLEQAADALANDGMLQRFQLLVYPDHRRWEWRDRMPDKEARDRAFSVFDALADFDPEEWGAAPADDFAKFPFFRFDEAAQEIFIEWSGDLHRVKLPAEDQPIIVQHLAKYDKLFPALALILHLVESAATGKRGPVTVESALRAAAWCDFLEAHARRCYGLLLDEGFRSARALADKVRQGCLTDGFTARDVRRNQWSSLKKGDAVEAALEWLEDEGWLRSEQTGGDGPGTGRRTRRYFINPKIVKG